jgi:hypothetical protein
MIMGKMQINKQNPIYNWEDQIYRDFMMGLLRFLEPRKEEKGTIIFKSL